MNPYVVESLVRSISIALVLISILFGDGLWFFQNGYDCSLPNCIPLLWAVRRSGF